MKKREQILLIGIGGSIIMIVVFSVSQALDALYLKLPVQWFALALMPIIISLFYGGFLQSFKGFGIELKSAIKAPVTSLNLTTSDALADIPGDEKKSISYLENMSKEKMNSIRWLLFTSGKSDYYAEWAIIEYLKRLPKLEFFEVRSNSGDLICFIPIETFKTNMLCSNEQFNRERISAFIRAIDEDRVPSAFSDVAITLKINSNSSLVDALKKMRAENTNLAAVISDTGRYLGVVFARNIESRIAESVLISQKA